MPPKDKVSRSPHPLTTNAALTPPTPHQKKAVEDKTFGLKNKKGAKDLITMRISFNVYALPPCPLESTSPSRFILPRIGLLNSALVTLEPLFPLTMGVGKYVELVKNQAESAGNRKMMDDAAARKKAAEQKKMSEQQRKAELAELFKPVAQVQKVPFGVDPKTIVCNFFKQGTCQKGSKCKFSHDKDLDRKGTKIDMYADAREKEVSKKDDSMETWDDAKLAAVVDSKQALDNKNMPTEIVCKFFLDAIEDRKYGWFWECPNGGKTCKYRHALPPGYILKKKETEAERREREKDEKENAITIEDFLDTERHNLGPNLTPITEESFNKWKKDRQTKADAENAAAAKAKADAFKKMKSGMKSGMALSGKDLFDFNPDWAVADEDDEDGAMDVYVREDSDHEGEELDPVEEYLGEDDHAVDDILNDKGKGRAEVVAELFDVDELAGLEDDSDDEA
ncbi:hypothetical protein HDU98_005071 [Podochytrium sp. JEL0797]|nr:hypothetical protein HDU98_005071 [Podochytrium sp. JEL0797]